MRLSCLTIFYSLQKKFFFLNSLFITLFLLKGIRLQPKGPPDYPTKLKATRMGHNFVTLSWTPGFDGGIHNTKYFVAYRRVGEDDSNNCLAPTLNYQTNRGRGDGWQEFDCQSYNPCNITSLEQHHSYRFKVNF